jgi:cation diffusion facilitator CzcD-associated flavoprotein CzcO
MGPGYGVKEGEHIPGAVLHKFLTDFAERYNILQLVKFRTTMTIAEKMDNGWRCTLETGDASATETSSLTCSKLMVATGLHSRAQPVHFSGEDNFKAPVLRFQDLARDGPHFLGDPKIETVTVFGGGKSAYDLVYYFASKGKKVEWIIRKSGHGPGWASTSHVALGWLEKLSTTRAMSWASPCIWGSADGYGWIRNVLHGTVVGRWLVDKFWAAVQSDIIKSNKYRNHPETEKLIPDAR